DQSWLTTDVLARYSRETAQSQKRRSTIWSSRSWYPPSTASLQAVVLCSSHTDRPRPMGWHVGLPCCGRETKDRGSPREPGCRCPRSAEVRRHEHLQA